MSRRPSPQAQDSDGMGVRPGDVPRALLNILEDSDAERAHLAGGQRAFLNILEDLSAEKARLEGAQRAFLNILEDFSAEKDRMEAAQRALLNILDDFDAEKEKVAVANGQLRAEVAERGRAEQRISQINARLAAANEELEAFSYSVAHDLRAPLRHIAGFGRMLAERLGPRLEPETRELLDLVLSRNAQMGQLVEALLNLARIGRHQLTLHTTSLAGLARAAVAELAAETAGRAIEWRLGPLPEADCDSALLRQVFVNLLSNAVKFTRARAPAVIEVGSFVAQGRPVVFVRDNGAGFNMKYAGKLFGVFQRLHRFEEFGGTGIGLAIVRRVIDKHGGRVWVEAAEGRGATFYFTLAAAASGGAP